MVVVLERVEEAFGDKVFETVIMRTVIQNHLNRVTYN